MLARCARCQGTFTTDRYGRQACPQCGAELILPAPPGTPEEPEAPAPPPESPRAAPPPPPQGPPSGPPRGEQRPAGWPPPPAAGAPPPGWPPPPPSPPGGGWGAAPPPPPPPPGPELPSPFADRRRLGFFASFFETWKLVATQPQHFFGRVRADQPWVAILFGVLASTVGNVAASIYAYFSGQQAILALQQMVQNLPEDQARFFRLYSQALTGGAVFAQAVLAPIVTFVLIYVAAAIVHLLLMLLRGAHRGFDATLTAVAYVSGLLLLLAVPGCGSLLALVWGLVSLVLGLGAIQRCGSGKAAAAVMAPFVLVCICCCGAIGLTVPGFLKGAQDAAKSVPTTNL